MSKKEKPQPLGSQEAQLANIIVEDTIKSAYLGVEGMSGIEIIKQGLAMLEGDDGLKLAQSMMGQYCGSLGAMTASVSGSDIDMRVFEIASRSKRGGLNINAGLLRHEMIKQIEKFIGYPEERQNAMVTALQNPVS